VHVAFGGPPPQFPPGLSLHAEIAGDGYASAIAAAGDLNVDGRADLVVGAPLADVASPDMGRTLVYFGGNSIQSTPDRSMTGLLANANLGQSVAGVGDANGDGKDDLLVGVPGLVNGYAFLYFGGIGFDTNADGLLPAQAVGERFGERVSRCGDVNGDGRRDFMVGAPNNNSVYVYFGRSVIQTTPDLALHGDGRFGDALAAGDFDGDGHPDLIVGAPLHGTGGRVLVFRGGPGILDATPDWIFDSPVAGEKFGAAVSAGDVDADGDADLVVGTQNPSPTDSPRVYIFAGGPSADTAVDRVLFGFRGTRFGAAVAADRDLTGDGRIDVAVGASASPAHGRVFIYTGIDLATDVQPNPPAADAATQMFLGLPRETPTGVQIDYAIDRSIRDARLEVFNIMGRRLRVLWSGAREPGRYALTWDRHDAKGIPIPRGVYLVRMQAGSFQAARKVVVLRP